ncbi:MAG: cupin domain-containing protein [Acidimicrobiales bacterium]
MSWIGKLADGSAAPEKGETTVELWRRDSTVVVEQILTGHHDGPIDFRQSFDEWVLLLSGSADLEIRGEVLTLRQGDWVVLEAGTPHRLVRAEVGTTWLAVKAEVPSG